MFFKSLKKGFLNALIPVKLDITHLTECKAYLLLNGLDFLAPFFESAERQFGVRG